MPCLPTAQRGRTSEIRKGIEKDTRLRAFGTRRVAPGSIGRLHPVVPGSLAGLAGLAALAYFYGLLPRRLLGRPQPSCSRARPSWQAPWKMTTAECRLQITRWLVGQHPREAYGARWLTTTQLFLVMPSCRAAPCHAMPAAQQAASGRRPAASSARHTTRSRELGPTILACPLVKIQERALQGKHKLGWP